MKLTKQYYYSAKGEKKINCFKINLSKELVEEAKIKEDDEIKIYVKDNKIIIEKVHLWFLFKIIVLCMWGIV